MRHLTDYSDCDCVVGCGRAKCKKYDQQSSIEETLQELERPVAADSEQSGPDQEGATAVVQTTPSTVSLTSVLHASKQVFAIMGKVFALEKVLLCFIHMTS